MAKFIEVTDARHGDELQINVDNIAWINAPAGTVCFSGVHGENHGLLTFNEENIKLILAAIGERR